MAPTIPMTAGRIYVCNFLTDGTDADEQELNGKTIGTDYFYFYMEEAIRGGETVDVTIARYPDHKGHIVKKGTSKTPGIYRGIVKTSAELGYMKTYMKKNNTIDNMTEPDYLFVMYGANDFEPFSDENGNVKEYCRGVLKATVPIRIPTESHWSVQIQFPEVWS
jgi:hypothetical protein